MISEKQLTKRANWILAVAWMIVIFGFSHQTADASDLMSSGIVDLVGGIIKRIVTMMTGGHVDPELTWLTFAIRKCAHAFLYAVLAVLVSRAICPDKIFSKKDFVIVLLICILYAASDEIHQLFLDGRSGEVRDVLIDGCGACVGMIFNAECRIKRIK